MSLSLSGERARATAHWPASHVATPALQAGRFDRTDAAEPTQGMEEPEQEPAEGAEGLIYGGA